MNMMRKGNLLPVLLALAWFATPASAQQRMMLPELDRFFKPDYSVREIGFFEARLGLDAQQILLLETLLQDYETDFLAGVTNLRDDLSSLQPLPTDVQSAYNQAQETMREDMEELVAYIQSHQSDPDYEEKIAGYKRQLQELMIQHRQTLESIVPKRLTGDQILSIGESMLARLVPWYEEQERLRSAFSAGMQSVLNNEQVERLPSIERSRRRERYLSQGRLSGESVDVWAILGKLSLDSETTSRLQPLLTEFAVNLDESLLKRRVVMDRGVSELFRAVHSGDVSRCVGLFDQELESRQHVRASIDEYARRIADQLPRGKAEVYYLEVLQKGYPRLYQTTHAHRLLDRAANLRNLDVTTSSSVQQLRVLYLADLNAVTDELHPLLQRIEPLLERQRLAQRYALKLAPPETELSDALQEGFRRRTEVDRKYRESLKGMLPEAVWSALNK